MSDGLEDQIIAECEEWESGRRYPLNDDKFKALANQIRVNPEAWWRVLQVLIVEAPNETAILNLAMGPLKATFECGPDRFVEEALSIARSSPRMASALNDGPLCNKAVDLYERLGREFVVDTLIRYHQIGMDTDFWAWETVFELVKNAPEEAWPVILQLIARASDAKMLGVIAAGNLEDFIMFHAGEYIDQIEAEAKTNPRFKEALRSVWIMELRPDLLDRVEAAAGVPLRRK